MPKETYAFPSEPKSITRDPDPAYFGMTLRDYFAAAALPEAIRIAAHIPHERPKLTIPPLAADLAYGIADAMMEARK